MEGIDAGELWDDTKSGLAVFCLNFDYDPDSDKTLRTDVSIEYKPQDEVHQSSHDLVSTVYWMAIGSVISTLFFIYVELGIALHLGYNDTLDDDPYHDLTAHYAQLTIWLRNSSFYDFMIFPPWERNIDQIDMHVEGA
eukprot:37768-Rhodomonas_salina.3